MNLSLKELTERSRAIGQLDAAELLLEFALTIEGYGAVEISAPTALRAVANNIVKAVEEKKARWKQEATHDHA